MERVTGCLGQRSQFEAHCCPWRHGCVMKHCVIYSVDEPANLTLFAVAPASPGGADGAIDTTLWRDTGTQPEPPSLEPVSGSVANGTATTTASCKSVSPSSGLPSPVADARSATSMLQFAALLGVQTRAMPRKQIAAYTT